MPIRKKMNLTDVAVRNAKPNPDDVIVISDIKQPGLTFEVRKTGKKVFRARVYIGKKEKPITIGHYPQISLQEAREKTAEYKSMAKSGRNPAVHKGAAELNTDMRKYQYWLQSYVDKKKALGRSESSIRKYDNALELSAKYIGSINVDEITVHDLEPLKRELLDRGAVIANSIMIYISNGFTEAGKKGYCQTDPTQFIKADIREALSEHEVRHYPSIKDHTILKEVIDRVSSYSSVQTAIMMMLLMHFFSRGGELRQARWRDLDFKHRVWVLDPTTTKKGREHIIPLTDETIALLELQRSLHNKADDGCIWRTYKGNEYPSNQTLPKAMRRLGIPADLLSPHGLRGTASTYLHGSQLWSSDAVEKALNHLVGNETRRSYDSAALLKQREEMAQAWSQHLATLGATAESIIETPKVKNATTLKTLAVPKFQKESFEVAV